MSDVRINTRSPYYIEANPTEPTQPTIPTPVENNTPPTVTITVSNENPYVGETVTLTAVATDSDGTIVGYQWGGFSTATTQSITATNLTLIQSQIFTVTVTDNDGDTATAIKGINWQERPEPTENSDRNVNCGDTVNEATFVGLKTYNLIGVGDKIGLVQIQFLDGGGNQDSPVIFNINWNGSTVTTGYVGDSNFLTQGITLAQDNRTSPTNKNQPTTLTINKTAASPTEVTLTAFSPLANDSYSFKLNCPNVEATTTFFYTLTGTRSSGNTTFTYTDVNGATQNEILANGATKLVSAQENTVSAAVCTGTIEEGSQSFVLGNPEQEYDSKVEIIIIFDNSGSMANTLPQLQSMVDGNLKTKLLSFYNGDTVEYNKRVRVYTASEFAFNTEFTISSLNPPTQDNKERFLKSASHGKVNSDASKSIYIYFQDEAGGAGAYQNLNTFSKVNNVWQATTDYTQVTSNYTSDLAGYRTFLDSKSYGEHFMKFFIVETNATPQTTFLQNIFSGNEGFSGAKGLSDRSEVSSVGVLQSGVPYSSNPNYYFDFVIQALTDYGFNI